MRKLIFILIVLFLGACHSHTFIPQTQNVPLLTDKGQVSADVAFTNKSIEVQVAGSPVNHLGIMINAMGKQYGSMLELGVGYFHPFSEKIIAEIYGGYAYGNLKYEKLNLADKTIFGTVGYSNTKVDINANRFFIQPNFGVKFNDKIELAISLKSCLWSFPNYYSDEEYWKRDDGGGYYHTRTVKDSVNLRNATQITYETAITFKVGGKYAKFMLQTGMSFYQNEYKTAPAPYNDFPVFIRLGACGFIDIGKIVRRDQK